MKNITESTLGKEPDGWMGNINPVFREALKPLVRPQYIHCTKCGKPCSIIHDLDMSACCFARAEVREIRG